MINKIKIAKKLIIIFIIFLAILFSSTFYIHKKTNNEQIKISREIYTLKKASKISIPQTSSYSKITENYLPFNFRRFLIQDAKDLNIYKTTYINGSDGFEIRFIINKLINDARVLLDNLVGSSKINSIWADSYAIIEGKENDYLFKIEIINNKKNEGVVIIKILKNV